MTEWTKCPKCEGSIPKGWSRHDKCGWNCETENKAEMMETGTAPKEQQRTLTKPVCRHLIAFCPHCGDKLIKK